MNSSQVASLKTDDKIQTSGNDLAAELSHVTREMYKKNLELAERNKTLSLLRKIDEIILSAVTDIEEIAQQVVNIVASQAEFKGVIIFLLDKKENELVKLATSKTLLIATVESEMKKPLYAFRISLDHDRNLISRAAKNRKLYVTYDMSEVLLPGYTREEAQKVRSIMGVELTLLYPLIVREEVIGVMVVNSGETDGELSAYKKDLVDRLTGVVGIAIDNALLYQKIQEVNRRLQELEKLKDEFVSLASHELRTPMTVIKSYVWLLLQGKAGAFNEKQKLYLDRTYASTDRLINLVNDMLNVSRIESGRLILEMKPVHIVQLVQDVISEMQPRAQELEVSLGMQEISGDLPFVLADPGRIKEVLINLIGNSLKFTPKSGHITISLFEKDGMVVTQVHDTGMGIKQEDIPNLFQKFGIVGNNYLIKIKTQGTGLGLYISKSIVELHGGEIWAQSEGESKGSTFSFSLKTVK